MIKIDMSKYKIIEDGGKKFILVSQVPDYAREYFGSRFGIPAYRTIRFHVTKGVLERPQKLGKETYFELDYILGAIKVMRILVAFNLSVNQMRGVIKNARRLNQFEDVFYLVECALGKFRNQEAKDVFIKQLSTRKPGEISVSDITSKYPAVDENF